MANKAPKILYVNNYPTHHMLSLAESLYKICGNNFRTVILYPQESDREGMEWKDKWTDAPWLIRVWESLENAELFEKWLEESDVTIFLSYYAFGNLPRVKKRLANNKLCLSFGERRWKPSHPFFELKKISGFPTQIIRAARILKHAWPLNRKQHHLLAIGIYAAWDEQQIGMFKNRMWTWAYFVSNSRLECSRKNPGTARILWAGRMLHWKKVDTLIMAIKILTEKSIVDFKVDLIGDGPEKQKLNNLVESLNLGAFIKLHPFMQPEEIRREMSQSDIFVWPSNSEEGWGVVINEAMAEGCAVVACCEAGAAPILIEDGKTGFLFPQNDSHKLAEILEKLIPNADYRDSIGKAAKEHIELHWSPDVAAERIIDFSIALLEGKQLPKYTSGPLSPAIIKRPNRNF